MLPSSAPYLESTIATSTELTNATKAQQAPINGALIGGIAGAMLVLTTGFYLHLKFKARKRVEEKFQAARREVKNDVSMMIARRATAKTSPSQTELTVKKPPLVNPMIETKTSPTTSLDRTPSASAAQSQNYSQSSSPRECTL
jgi:hypothetical protein